MLLKGKAWLRHSKVKIWFTILFHNVVLTGGPLYIEVIIVAQNNDKYENITPVYEISSLRSNSNKAMESTERMLEKLVQKEKGSQNGECSGDNK